MQKSKQWFTAFSISDYMAYQLKQEIFWLKVDNEGGIFTDQFCGDQVHQEKVVVRPQLGNKGYIYFETINHGIHFSSNCMISKLSSAKSELKLIFANARHWISSHLCHVPGLSQFLSYPVLERGSTVLLLLLLCVYVTLEGPFPPEFWNGWTGELWTKTNILNW